MFAFQSFKAMLKPAGSNLHTGQYPPTLISIAYEFLSNAVDRIETNREGLLHRHHGVWPSIRCVSRSALQLLGMACNCQRDGGCSRGHVLEMRLLPPGWIDTIYIAIDFLTYWSAECADARRMHKIISGILEVYYVLSRR